MIYFFSSVTSIDLFSVGGVLLFCVCVLLFVLESHPGTEVWKIKVSLFSKLYYILSLVVMETLRGKLGVRVIFYLFFFFLLWWSIFFPCVWNCLNTFPQKKKYIFSLKLKLSPKNQMFLEIHFLEDFDFLMKYNFLTQINFSQDSFSIKNINL